MQTARPFPFAALPAISREEIAGAARLREAAARLVRHEAIAAAIGELCGEAISIRSRRTRRLDVACIPADAVGVAFAPADAPGLSRAVLVEMESALASSLVARALRQRTPRISDASRGPSADLAGAVAALVHAALRRVHAEVPLRVVAAGPAQALARDLAGTHHRVVTAWLTVVVGGDAFDARVDVPLDELPNGHGTACLSVEALLRMPEVPIALPLVIATCFAGRAELSSLRVGDAFILPRLELREASGRIVGPVAIVASASERGLAGDLAEGGRLVLRTKRSTHSWDCHTMSSEDPPMSGEPNTTLEVLEDAPVVVRVELGVVEMKAREWAALAPGDVVTLGRKLGDPAILRVGGVEFARGEIVQVDGEYGVRILAAARRAGEQS